ncbi:MAG: hypothetical protein J3Q66DRAFT_393924 [Benniella sp.]|nr:MAG: hypothetical protein J3Q66DRAFT_393924 [Benniella sp.]
MLRHSPGPPGFLLVHDLQGYTCLSQYRDDHLSSRGENDVDEGPGAPDVVQVEVIIEYIFTNKKLLEEALTEPSSDTSIRPNYERLEFLGDSVLDVVATTAWIDSGEPLVQVSTKAQVTVTNATFTAAGLEAGLEAYIRNPSESTIHEIDQMKEHLREQMAICPPNKAPQTLKNPCPTYDRLEYLGDAVLDVVASDLWIARGQDLRKFSDIVSESTCNQAWQAICVETGLWQYIPGCDANTMNNIAATRANLEAEKLLTPDRAYWKRVRRNKVLADVVESVLGAIFSRFKNEIGCLGCSADVAFTHVRNAIY